MTRQVITDGRLLSGVPTNILRGIVPTATLWDGNIGFAYQAKTGGTVFTDFSAAANNATVNDVTIFDATMQAQDAFYFGENFSTSGPFNSLLVNVGTLGNYSATGVWEYYNGAWVTLTVTDGTNGFKTAGSNYVTWTIPGDMTHVTVNAQDRYWVRFRISAFTSLTTAPLATQIWLGRYPTSLSNVTDGNTTTVSDTGVLLSGAALTYGSLVFDTGRISHYIFTIKHGEWSSAGTVLMYVQSSNDGSTYDNGQSYGNRFGSVVATTERIVTSNINIFGRYIKISFNISAAGTVYNKFYTTTVHELEL